MAIKNLTQQRFLQPLRSNILATYELAVEALKNVAVEIALTDAVSQKADGSQIVARYYGDDNVVKSIFGIYSNETKSITIYDADVEKMKEIEDAIAAAEKSAKAAATLINEKTSGFVTVKGEQDDTTGAWTYTIEESDIASATALTAESSARQQADQTITNNLNTEIADRKAQDDKIEASIGLAEDGSYVATNGNYTSKATTVVGAIEALDTQVKANTDAIDALEGLMGEQSVATQITKAINDLDVTDDAVENQYVSSVSEADGKISVERKALVSSSDKVLTFTENGITSTISVAKLTPEEVKALGENVAEAYKLVGKDSTQLGETIKIYKDQSLKEVKLDGQELVFTYVLADGKESEVRVDVSAFLSEEEYGNGLQVVDHVISAKLGEDTETNKNFLDLEGDEDGKKSLVVRSIDTDSTKLQKDLKVAGLNAQFGAGNYNNNDVIPAGTDLYTILQNILCKELYPTNVNGVSASASATMSNLTLTLDKSGDVEVGTLVKLTAGKTNGSSTSSLVNSSLSGMEYGYSASDDDSVDSTDTTITKTISTAIADNNYTISATINRGFNADTETNVKTTPTTATGVGSAELAETALGCIIEGENKITINATGASYSYAADAISGVYYCSNLGNTDAAKYHAGVSAVSSTTNKPTKSTNATVTDKYKYFLGYSENTAYSQFDSASVRALTTKSSWVAKDSTTTIVAENAPITSNGKSIVIACPSKYKLASISNGVGADILANFSSVGEVDVTTGSIVTKYKVYVYPITNGATVEFKKVTLAKA